MFRKNLIKTRCKKSCPSRNKQGNCQRQKNTTVKIFALQDSVLVPVLREQNWRSPNYKSGFCKENEIELNGSIFSDKKPRPYLKRLSDERMSFCDSRHFNSSQ